MADADLLPSQVAVLVPRGSKEAMRLAEEYMSMREIPAEHICAVEMSLGDELERSEWESSVRPAIRRWLAQKGLHRQLRCFVTVWDVPLTIGASTKTSRVRKLRLAHLKDERSRRLARLERLIAQLHQLAGLHHEGDNSFTRGLPQLLENERIVLGPIKTETDVDEIQKNFERFVKAAQVRISAMQDENQKRAATQELSQVGVSAAGLKFLQVGLRRALSGPLSSDGNLKSAFEALNGQVQGYHECRELVEARAQGIDRDSLVLDIIQREGGYLESLQWIDSELTSAQNATNSSFDSELSLVLWDPYEVSGWQENYLHFRFDDSALRQVRPTLIVARMDAPTLELARRLFHDAIRAELDGIDGVAYFDSRGLTDSEKPKSATVSVAYDQALLDAAALIRANTSVGVVSEDSAATLAKGDGDKAVLYAGWYAPFEYSDAFTWQPGAIGYHLSAGEAVRLRKHDSQGWCKRMLESGVCATLGSIDECEVDAFPRPNEFYALLLSGDYSIAECFYRTKAYNSWKLVLFGDPLYNPFRNRPAFDVKNLSTVYQRIHGLESVAR